MSSEFIKNCFRSSCYLGIVNYLNKTCCLLNKRRKCEKCSHTVTSNQKRISSIFINELIYLDLKQCSVFISKYYVALLQQDFDQGLELDLPEKSYDNQYYGNDRHHQIRYQNQDNQLNDDYYELLEKLAELKQRNYN